MAGDFAARIANASTLQCQGRPGTGHVRLVANPLAGDQIHVAAQPVTADERWYSGSGVVYRFTSSGPAPAGEVPVVIGAAVDASAAALTRAMRGQQSHLVRAWDSS